MTTPTDLAYEYAATVDGEWGCCHDEHDLRAGGRAPSFNGDEFEPLPADCLGAGVVAKWLPLLAAHDAALIAKAKAEGAAEALRAAADAIGACVCDRGPRRRTVPSASARMTAEPAARFYLGYAVDVLRDRAAGIES